MNPNGDILDRNIRLLLQRAYVPVLPAPEFRDDLQRTLLSEVRRRTRERIGARSAAGNRVGWLVAVAAAVLAFLFGWAIVQSSTVEPTPDESVAQDQPEIETPLERDLVEGPTDDALAVDERRTVEEVPEVAAGGADEEDQLASLGGTVRGPAGEPITDFRVGLLRERVGNDVWPPSTRDFESEEGTFAWEEIPPARYRVYVHAEGFAIARLDFAETTDESELDVRLKNGGTVRGHVTDARTGNPVPGALVYTEEDAPQDGILFQDADSMQWLPVSARTLADGSFELQHVTAGDHNLWISAPGYAPEWIAGVTVSEDGTVEGLAISLGHGASVAGLVTGEDGAPISNAQLIVAMMDNAALTRIHFSPAQTDADGRYRVDDLPAMLMIVGLVDPLRGNTPTVKPIELRGGATATVDFRGEASGVTLTGHVTYASGEPVVHHNMGLYAKEWEDPSFSNNFLASTTDGDGNYRFDDLDPGEYVIYLVEDMGRWITFAGTVDVPDWPEYPHDIRILDAAIRGRVTDGRNDEPLAGTNVILEIPLTGWGGPVFAGNAVTDADGAYEFRMLGPGSYTVTAFPTREGLGFERREDVSIGEAEPEATVDLQLLSGGSVEVVVTGPAGAPIPYANIVLYDDEGRSLSVSQYPFTDDDGRFVAQGVRVGRYHVLAEAPDFESVKTPVVVRAAERNLVRIELPALEVETNPTERNE